MIIDFGLKLPHRNYTFGQKRFFTKSKRNRMFGCYGIILSIVNITQSMKTQAKELVQMQQGNNK